MATVQERNAEQIALLLPDLCGRYEANRAWADAIGMHLMLPALRAFWPMSSVNESTQMIDISGQARHLQGNGAGFGVSYNGLAPFIESDGASGYASRADEAGLDITVDLTWGGWFYFDVVARAEGMAGKWNEAGVNQRSYLLYHHAGGNLGAFISTDGINPFSVNSSANVTVGWHHAIGRFTHSSELAIFLDGVKTVNSVGVPASIFNSNAAFEIFAFSGAANYMDGKASLQFLSVLPLSDLCITELYAQTRALFGV